LRISVITILLAARAADCYLRLAGEAQLKFTIGITAVSLMLAWPVHAQKLVDPDKVAPQYRQEAEKRRAEQISQIACAKKATTQNVLPRDRTAFINDCIGKAEAKAAKE
jgi:hypothetical protein